MERVLGVDGMRGDREGMAVSALSARHDPRYPAHDVLESRYAIDETERDAVGTGGDVREARVGLDEIRHDIHETGVDI
jgi:hypothetical protein